MRLWSIHPKYLDPQGLVALWREGLLAQKVLQGQTKGYRNHPQLLRFSATDDPLLAIGSYLSEVASEAKARGYAFDESKVVRREKAPLIFVAKGQLLFEWQHFLNKVEQRAPLVHLNVKHIELPDPHPLFAIVEGKKAEWERGG